MRGSKIINSHKFFQVLLTGDKKGQKMEVYYEL